MTELSYNTFPLFIIGNPRSGTTLLRLIINSHPEVCIPPESHFFLWLEKKYENWTRTDGYRNYLTDLYESTKFETWGLSRYDLESFLNKNNPESYSELNELVYLFYANQRKKKTKIWGDKNKLWKEKLPHILKYYPNAKFIHIHRDGRDVACSYKNLNSRNIRSKYAPKLPSDIESIALKWQENIQFLEAFQESVLKENFLKISYEKLLENTEEVGNSICDFLGIEAPKDGLNHLGAEKGNDEPQEFLQWKEKTNEPIDLKNIGKYKKELSKVEIDTFNSICSDELKKLGYDLF